jgi:hypothetical protein
MLAVYFAPVNNPTSEIAFATTVVTQEAILLLVATVGRA